MTDMDDAALGPSPVDPTTDAARVMNRDKVCPRCLGARQLRSDPNRELVDCEQCSGTGVVQKEGWEA